MLLDPTYISENCDYSFGDQSGHQHRLCVMKDANPSNFEFRNKVQEIKNSGRSYMTLFIDNIRLYNRTGIKYTSLEMVNEQFKKFKDDAVESLFAKNDLLKLCALFPYMRFIIFTGFEDTPIDDEIFDKIPDNVISIYPSNAISFGGKVHPIPYGIQRKLSPWDNRHEILLKMVNDDTQPINLLYCNHSVGVNPERVRINELLKEKDWVTIKSPISIDDENYTRYLKEIKSHKFVLCPDGNAIGCECHRDWEVLYMRRVPVVKRTKYLTNMFEGIPVLFIDDYSDISKDLLIQNNHLYESMQSLDMNRLDMKFIYDNCVKKSLS